MSRPSSPAGLAWARCRRLAARHADYEGGIAGVGVVRGQVGCSTVAAERRQARRLVEAAPGVIRAGTVGLLVEGGSRIGSERAVTGSCAVAGPHGVDVNLVDAPREGLELRCSVVMAMVGAPAEAHR